MINQNPAPTTELEAVNALLEIVGEAPVSSLDDLAPDAASAVNTLNRVSREVQARGWHWNTTVRRLVANSDSEFLLPSNTIRADTIRTYKHIDVTVRGRKLFDRRPFNNSTKFPEKELEVEIIEALSWDDLPEAARQYIYIRASRQFQEFNLGSAAISRFSEDDEAYALAVIVDDELTTGDYNYGSFDHPSYSRGPAHFWRT